MPLYILIFSTYNIILFIFGKKRQGKGSETCNSRTLRRNGPTISITIPRHRRNSVVDHSRMRDADPRRIKEAVPFRFV